MSNRGQRACAEHAPEVASPEFWQGRWELMSEDAQLGFERANGRPPWCTACRALAELAAHETQTHDGVGGAT
jgi:hypothetical protein